jgi:hypothetical protein
LVALVTTVELPAARSPDLPKEPGWYVVYRRHSERPVVLWWGTLSTAWREGAQQVQVDAWVGPFPMRKGAQHGEAIAE